MAQVKNWCFFSKNVKLVYSSFSNDKCVINCIPNIIISRQLKTVNYANRFNFPKYIYLAGTPKLTTFFRPASQDTTRAGLEDSATKKQNLSLADELLATKVSSENKEESEDTSESDKKEKTLRGLKISFCVVAGLLTCGVGFFTLRYGPPQEDEAGNPVKDEFSNLPIIQQYFYRAIHEAKQINRSIQEPTSDKLLPDPLREPYIQPPYTLVLELKDVLVHPEWDWGTGWRFRKRPGVDFLLQHCGPPLFEIVIYTNESGFTAYPVIEKLDPNSFVWYKLFKDSTRYVDGKHIKDLNCLNRDLSKVIIVDWDIDAVSSPRNELSLVRWEGNMNDQTLIELAMMLRTIAESQVSDVREVLDYYRTFSDPIAAFKENQRIAQQYEEEVQKTKGSSLQKGFTSSWANSFLRRK